MNVLLTVAYDGTRYSGWQRQLNGPSVQEELEARLSVLFNAPVSLTAASRTDAGVHALGQKAAFSTVFNPYPMSKLPTIINTKLPADISITDACVMPDNFNPRYAAKQKTYTYSIYNATYQNPLRRLYSWHVWQPLNVPLMQDAASFIIGKQDYACFRAAGGHAKTSVRTIFKLSVYKNDENITLYVTGDGFLYKMVRNIVGTLVYVGMGKISPSELPYIIASKDRTLAGKTAPPQGLTLAEVLFN